jgi:hypothetical protein
LANATPSFPPPVLEWLRRYVEDPTDNDVRDKLTNNQRALVGGAVLLTPGTGLTAKDVAGRLGYGRSDTHIRRGRDVLQSGNQRLVMLVWDDELPVNTGWRFTTVDRSTQDDLLDKLAKGYNLRSLLPPDPRGPQLDRRTKVHRGRSSKYRQHSDNLQTTVNQLRVLTQYGLDPIDSLDEAIQEEEAQKLVSELSTTISSLYRVRNLLVKRDTQ